MKSNGYHSGFTLTGHALGAISGAAALQHLRPLAGTQRNHSRAQLVALRVSPEGYGVSPLNAWIIGNVSGGMIVQAACFTVTRLIWMQNTTTRLEISPRKTTTPLQGYSTGQRARRWLRITRTAYTMSFIKAGDGSSIPASRVAISRKVKRSQKLLRFCTVTLNQ